MGRIDFDAVKARHSLAAVARRTGLAVADSGRAMVACPMPDHDDSTPSMQLDLDRQKYRCFGCDAHGDVVQWVRDIEDVTTAQALAILDADRPIVGVLTAGAVRSSPAVPKREAPDPARTPAIRVLAANTMAWRYYTHGQLHERGVAYLADRGINVATLETEQGDAVVGHTPSARTRIDGLVTWLTSKGFSDDELVDSGLATRNPDRSVIDFFRDRAILPIKDSSGRIVGLVGRDVTDRSKVKYLNPPRTHTYNKATVLYRPSNIKLDPHEGTVVCEGPLDALAIAAQAADADLSRFFAPVAACGRVLSDTQIDAILAIHPRPPVLAADGDQPGRDANLDWATRILAKGRESVITTWPDGHDPGSWLAAHGADGLRAVTRRGCLHDSTGVLRPRHCGAVLTEAAFPDHDQHRRPDRTELVGVLTTATGNLGPAARQRYIDGALSVFGLPPSLLTEAPAGAARCPSIRRSPDQARTFPARNALSETASPQTIPAERIPI